MKPITATFIDEISHDIPHQNWGAKEWTEDFKHMKMCGIDTVVLIRSGYGKWLTYPSSYLIAEERCFAPPIDLVELFLGLADELEMDFYFGLYDSGKYWWSEGKYQKEVDVNRHVIDEVWKRYGGHKSFRGWYITQEVSKRIDGIVGLYNELGRHCKEVSGGLPTLISPYIDGKKAVMAAHSELSKADAISLKKHEEDWDEILSGIKENVDILAFQDGHVDFHELPDYLAVNKNLANKYGLQPWSNCESFDRDMPIKFLPIKWEKMLLKLVAAQKAGIEKVITFEFSHFMSPQSAYVQAHHLYNRYMEAYESL